MDDTVVAAVNANYMPSGSPNRDGLSFAFDMNSQAWWKWGVGRNEDSNFNYWNTPYLFMRTKDSRTFAATPGGIVRVDQCFRDYPLMRRDGQLPVDVGDELSLDDAMFDTTGTPTVYQVPVRGTVSIGPIIPVRGSTVRLQELQVEHSTAGVWVSPPSPAPSRPIRVWVSTDPIQPVPAYSDEFGSVRWDADSATVTEHYDGRVEVTRFSPSAPAGVGSDVDLSATRFFVHVEVVSPSGGRVEQHRLLGVFALIS